MQALFTVTLLVSAGLLFVVQPMFAKMVLPVFGGAPAVWNTCMVFYQVMLLGGYAYAHTTSRFLSIQRQAILHLALLALPWLVMPISVSETWIPSGKDPPLPWLVMQLTVSVGLPVFVVSTAAPLLQSWFARTGHRHADDPYFLYAASNTGSLAALLGYPIVLEPMLRLADQQTVWSAGYGLLCLLTFACACALWRTSRDPQNSVEAARPHISRAKPASSSPDWKTRFRWLALSAVPSSLLLGVTAHLTTDIAAVPLLWIVPLTLYLVTFILAFARRQLFRQSIVLGLQALLMVFLGVVFFESNSTPPLIGAFLHLTAFFASALVCHRELVRSRPSTDRLTEFYLWIACGGALGGSFNALAAPFLFPLILEYPLMLVAAGLLRPTEDVSTDSTRAGLFDVAVPLAVLACGVAAITWLQPSAGASRGVLRFLPVAAAVVVYLTRRRPLRFGMGIAAMLILGFLGSFPFSRTHRIERTFFGVSRVTLNMRYKAVVLNHGTTTHGMQSFEKHRELEPLTYYHPSGPLGDVFRMQDGQRQFERIGVVGLGAGSIACYGTQGQRMTFYEIDPAVEQIATDTNYFTFLAKSPAFCNVVLGDARLSLTHVPDWSFDLIILDAFSSDAVPIHLITREAVALYLQKIKPTGVLAIHVSNRHLHLTPVLGNIAASLDVVALTKSDDATEQERLAGKLGSDWVVIGADESELGSLTSDRSWKSLRRTARLPTWTDDFSSIIKVLKR
jgi:hypothetical protein